MFVRSSRLAKSLQSGIALLVTLIFIAGLFAGQEGSGQAIFEAKCASCHGKDGKAGTKIGKTMKIPDFTKSRWKHGNSTPEIEKLIGEGDGKMPKFAGKMSPADIAAVARYTRNLALLGK